MVRKLRRLADLSPSEWTALVPLSAFSFLTGLGLRLLPLPRLMHLVLRSAPLGRLLPGDPSRLADLAACASPGAGRCLARSIALTWLLRARGEPAELRIGAARDGTALLSHAWVELGGNVVGEAPDRFTPLLRF